MRHGNGRLVRARTIVAIIATAVVGVMMFEEGRQRSGARPTSRVASEQRHTGWIISGHRPATAVGRDRSHANLTHPALRSQSHGVIVDRLASAIVSHALPSALHIVLVRRHGSMLTISVSLGDNRQTRAQLLTPWGGRESLVRLVQDTLNQPVADEIAS